MKHPLRISFHNVAQSAAVKHDIRQRAEKLETFFDRITSCHVTIESPHRHHRKGKAFQVRIDLKVPGREIVINRASNRLDVSPHSAAAREREFAEQHRPSKHGAHEDLYVAIRDAFNAAGRQLQDYVRRQSGAVKTHLSRIPRWRNVAARS